MGKVLLGLTAILLASYSSNGANIDETSMLRNSGELNTYHAYNSETAHQPVLIKANIQDVSRLTRNFRAKVVILIHDHLESHGTSLDTVVNHAIFATEDDVTIVVVDWSQVARMPYANAVSLAPVVGANIEEFIRLLLRYRRVNLANLHIIGFGLGAHIAGIASRNINVANTRVARVTGLNPSRVDGLTLAVLKPDDADYVEGIHTDGDGTDSRGIGRAIGNADFFVNGGKDQPKCSNNDCSHTRAYELFAASIVYNTFEGKRCRPNVDTYDEDNCNGGPFQLMGNNEVRKVGNGIFYVKTGGDYPFDQIDETENGSGSGSGDGECECR